jgi:hypothetical protein
VRARIPPALIVLSISAATFCLLSGVAYCLGRRVDPELCFLDPQRAPTIDEASVAQPINYSLRSHEENAAVFLGDSTCRTGVDPRALPFSAYNLGSLRGLGPSGFLLTLRAYLQGHPRPRVVTLVVTPFCFEVDPSRLDGELSQRVDASYGAHVEKRVSVAGFASFVKRGAVGLFRGADPRDRPLDGLARETYRTLEVKMRTSRGFFCLPGTHGKGQGVPMERPEKPVHPDWNRGIHLIAEACNDAGVPLLIRFSPIVSDARAARDFTQLDRWATDLEASQTNVTVARPIVLAYDPGLMWDSIHLNATGVEKFMPVVAQDVRGVAKR